MLAATLSMLSLTATSLVAGPSVHVAQPRALRLRSPPCVALEWPPAGIVVTILSGIAILTRPDSGLWPEPENELTDEQRQLTRALCRPDGWDFRASIGADLARSLGGTGSLAARGGAGGAGGGGLTAELSARVAFECDERFTAYPQGTATLLRPSKLLSARRGLWSVEPGSSQGPRDGEQVLELMLECEPIGPEEDPLVPGGPIYLSGVVALDEQASRVAALTSGRVQTGAIMRWEAGRVLVQEYVGALGAATGLKELKVVGSFEALPSPPAEPTTTPLVAPPPSPPPPSPPSPPPPSARVLSRRGGIGAAAASLVACVTTAAPPAAWAADGEAALVLPILGAQQSVRRILEDERTFKTVVQLGLPLGTLQMPPSLQFSLFRRLEASVREPGDFMDAAIEYVEYARDANDLLALAQMSRTNGNGAAAAMDYLDRALVSLRGAGKALDRMVPLLPM